MTMKTAREIKETIVKKTSDGSPICVFDLDSTLFNVTPRTEQILKDFTKTDLSKEKFSQYASRLEKVETRHHEWGIRSAIERLDIFDVDFFEAIKNHWVEHFFSNDYLKYDLPYEGAIQFVNDLYSSGCELTYLTGRYHDRMLEGTIASLEQHGFPINKEKVTLTLKPDRSIEDATYKVDVLGQIDKEKSIWFFENEPVIVNKTLKDLPYINTIFMDSVHSGREEAPTNIPSIPMSFN